MMEYKKYRIHPTGHKTISMYSTFWYIVGHLSKSHEILRAVTGNILKIFEWPTLVLINITGFQNNSDIYTYIVSITLTNKATTPQV